MKETTDGQRVEVQIYGNYEWYPGTVFKDHETWINLDLRTHGIGHVVDETNVREWRPVTETTYEQPNTNHAYN
jgi:hypothetical protein